MTTNANVPNMQRKVMKQSNSAKVILENDVIVFFIFSFLIISYLIFYCFPLFSSDSTLTHFVDSPAGFSNDKTSAIQMVYWFQNLESPWEMNRLINYPEGESLFSWQALTQAFQIYFLFFASKLASAKFAVLLLTILGSYLTAVSGFFLAKLIKLPIAICFIAGFLPILLPLWQVSMATHTSAVFFGIPVLNLCLFVYAVRNRDWWRNLLFIFGLSFTAVLDGYWFIYTLIAIGTFLISEFTLNIRANRQWLRTKSIHPAVLIYLLFFLAFSASTLFILNLSQENTTSRPLSITSLEVLRTNGITVSSLFSPEKFIYGVGEPILGYNSFYFGNVLLLFVLIGLFISRTLFTRFQASLLMVASLFLLMASQPEIQTIFGPTFGVSSLSRYITPGVVHNYRSLAVSFIIFIVLSLSILYSATKEIVQLLESHSMPNRFILVFKTLSIWVLMIAIWIDWNPLGSRFISQEDVRLEGISHELAGQPTVFFPETLYGRNWLQQGVLLAPMVNGNRSDASISRFENSLHAGDEELYALMKNNGVKNLVVDYRNSVPFFVSKEDRGALRRHPNPDLFQYVTQVHMPSYESRFVTLHLYKLK